VVFHNGIIYSELIDAVVIAGVPLARKHVVTMTSFYL